MINNILKHMRKQKGLSQEQLAKLLNIGRTTLAGYEQNYRDPKFEMIEAIANYCGYEIQFINKKTKEILTTRK